MKFGKSIRLQAKSNRGKHYLNFKLLKRKIRAMEEAIHNGSMDVAIQENHHFNEILLCDLGRVDCSFHRHLAEVKALVDAIHDQFRYLKTHPRVIRHLASIRHSASLAPYSHHRENGNGSGLVGVMPSTFEGLLDHLLQMEHYQEFRQLMENFAKAGQLLAKLRQYVVWNSVAVVKITKKRRKHTRFGQLDDESASKTLSRQDFYRSPELPNLVSSLDRLSDEFMGMVLEKPPARERLLCPICTCALTDPVSLSACAHRFCWNCLATSYANAKANNLLFESCPVCKRVTNLDPDTYRVDGILNRFLRTYFPDAAPHTHSTSQPPLMQQHQHQQQQQHPQAPHASPDPSESTMPSFPTSGNANVTPSTPRAFTPRQTPPLAADHMTSEEPRKVWRARRRSKSREKLAEEGAEGVGGGVGTVVEEPASSPAVPHLSLPHSVRLSMLGSGVDLIDGDMAYLNGYCGDDGLGLGEGDGDEEGSEDGYGGDGMGGGLAGQGFSMCCPDCYCSDKQLCEHMMRARSGEAADAALLTDVDSSLLRTPSSPPPRVITSILTWLDLTNHIAAAQPTPTPPPAPQPIAMPPPAHIKASEPDEADEDDTPGESRFSHLWRHRREQREQDACADTASYSSPQPQQQPQSQSQSTAQSTVFVPCSSLSPFLSSSSPFSVQTEKGPITPPLPNYSLRSEEHDAAAPSPAAAAAAAPSASSVDGHRGDFSVPSHPFQPHIERSSGHGGVGLFRRPSPDARPSIYAHMRTTSDRPLPPPPPPDNNHNGIVHPHVGASSGFMRSVSHTGAERRHVSPPPGFSELDISETDDRSSAAFRPPPPPPPPPPPHTGTASSSHVSHASRRPVSSIPNPNGTGGSIRVIPPPTAARGHHSSAIRQAEQVGAPSSAKRGKKGGRMPAHPHTTPSTPPSSDVPPPPAIPLSRSNSHVVRPYPQEQQQQPKWPSPPPSASPAPNSSSSSTGSTFFPSFESADSGFSSVVMPSTSVPPTTTNTTFEPSGSGGLSFSGGYESILVLRADGEYQEGGESCSSVSGLGLGLSTHRPTPSLDHAVRKRVQRQVHRGGANRGR
ncbi:unnamed protein product [Vitrella brassicaformis CCMP3155]|uniref:RING-type domain-containing protein n=3 Tax=Vitrella brassicaformis TaxID=1169539 RepID=A0A0G4F5B0_VITBC|nr:unnamed protein product [Vitrella brassicaformis CCMP3155]|eukprot:CEM07030.1 unnamed protein product [Vitrella brassicaformis CCMP3155]